MDFLIIFLCSYRAYWLINVYYYTNTCKNKLCKINIKIIPTCFGVNTPSSGSLQLCQLKLWTIKMIQYNIIVCCYDNILVNVTVYVLVQWIIIIIIIIFTLLICAYVGIIINIIYDLLSLWHQITWQVATKVSERPDVSFIRVQMNPGVSSEIWYPPVKS